MTSPVFSKIFFTLSKCKNVAKMYEILSALHFFLEKILSTYVRAPYVTMYRFLKWKILYVNKLNTCLHMFLLALGIIALEFLHKYVSLMVNFL